MKKKRYELIFMLSELASTYITNCPTLSSNNRYLGLFINLYGEK